MERCRLTGSTRVGALVSYLVTCPGLPMGGPAVPQVADVALRFVFYWYNFMPLTRGTAMCGLLALHAILLAAGYAVSEPLPEGVQIDWLAILTPEVCKGMGEGEVLRVRVAACSTLSRGCERSPTSKQPHSRTTLWRWCGHGWCPTWRSRVGWWMGRSPTWQPPSRPSGRCWRCSPCQPRTSTPR